MARTCHPVRWPPPAKRRELARGGRCGGRRLRVRPAAGTVSATRAQTRAMTPDVVLLLIRAGMQVVDESGIDQALVALSDEAL